MPEGRRERTDGQVIQPVNPAAPFHVEAETALRFQGRPQVTPYMAEPLDGRHVLLPIHLAVYLSVTNKQSVDSKIDFYRVEASETEGGPWVTMAHLDQATARWKFYMIDHRASIEEAVQHAIEVRFVNVLDTAIAERPLAPNENREGWSLWHCPIAECPGPLFRITVRDRGGARFTEFVRLPEDRDVGGRATMNKHSIVTAANADLTGYKFEMFNLRVDPPSDVR